ncbi:hypothetical protein CASbig_58 [Mycobacterium phage CASbig]|uniref:hypothetical protein n=1 Tax=Mycobacterium phage CASbig TaxID=1327035 RepID=UPI00032B478A|nr:hypothetical protein JMN56_gp58 [Mycobacterium phage CASbig]AGK88103.1 hypothetical protein CASbig_58 [Mycobacterium phage CASbig]
MRSRRLVLDVRREDLFAELLHLLGQKRPVVQRFTEPNEVLYVPGERTGSPRPRGRDRGELQVLGRRVAEERCEERERPEDRLDLRQRQVRGPAPDIRRVHVVRRRPVQRRHIDLGLPLLHDDLIDRPAVVVDGLQDLAQQPRGCVRVRRGLAGGEVRRRVTDVVQRVERVGRAEEVRLLDRGVCHPVFEPVLEQQQLPDRDLVPVRDAGDELADRVVPVQQLVIDRFEDQGVSEHLRARAVPEVLLQRQRSVRGAVPAVRFVIRPGRGLDPDDRAVGYLARRWLDLRRYQRIDLRPDHRVQRVSRRQSVGDSFRLQLSQRLGQRLVTRHVDSGDRDLLGVVGIRSQAGDSHRPELRHRGGVLSNAVAVHVVTAKSARHRRQLPRV